MLVTSVEVNKDTLACGVQPLDLITQLDGKQAEDLGDSFGQCNLLVKMTKTVVDVWILRTSLIPSMSDLQGEQLFTAYCLLFTTFTVYVTCALMSYCLALLKALWNQQGKQLFTALVLLPRTSISSGPFNLS